MQPINCYVHYFTRNWLTDEFKHRIKELSFKLKTSIPIVHLLHYCLSFVCSPTHITSFHVTGTDPKSRLVVINPTFHYQCRCASIVLGSAASSTVCYLTATASSSTTLREASGRWPLAPGHALSGKYVLGYMCLLFVQEHDFLSAWVMSVW